MEMNKLKECSFKPNLIERKKDDNEKPILVRGLSN